MNIQALRSRQRQQQSRAIERRTPSLYRIGDRDPATGRTELIYPDGSRDLNGLKLYGATHQSGDRVLAQQRSDGAWLMDGASPPPRRDAEQSVFGDDRGYLDGRIFGSDSIDLSLVWDLRSINRAAWSYDQSPLSPPQADFQTTIQRRVGPLLVSQLRLDFEDSINCGGTNDAIQAGIASSQIRGSGTAQVRLSLEGRIEQNGAGFDAIRIWTTSSFTAPTAIPLSQFDPPDAQLIYEASSTERGLQCVMEEVRATAEPFAIRPGQWLVIWISTRDPFWHKGAYWQINLELTAKP